MGEVEVSTVVFRGIGDLNGVDSATGEAKRAGLGCNCKVFVASCGLCVLMCEAASLVMLCLVRR